MPRFMGIHTVPAGAFDRQQVDQFAQAAQQHPVIKGYRSFANLSEGKLVCVMDAPSKEALTAWFDEMGMPYDAIVRLELEGEAGRITAL